MRKPLRLGRKGISEVFSLVILSSVMISTMLAAVFFAQLNIQVQSEVTEFENAKESMISLARMIEGLSVSEGSAAYTSFTANTCGLIPDIGSETLIVKVGDQTILTDSINRIMLRGGVRVTSDDFKILRGATYMRGEKNVTECLIVEPGDAAPLGCVYLKRENRPLVIVDFGRIRVVPSGVVPVTNDGRNWDKMNTVEMTYFKIVFGSFSGSNVYNICARIRNVTTYVKELPESTRITVRVERGSLQPEEYTSDQGGNGTLLFITIVEVEIQVRG
ncbi:MAG: hypothetical protein QXF52_02260 [Thermoproteota archaeon]